MTDRTPRSVSTSQEVRFEGFAVQTDRGLSRREAMWLVRAALGPGWAAEAVGDEGTDFDVMHPRARLSPAAAWDAAYRLRRLAGVAYAEPMFAVPVRWQASDGAPAPEEDFCTNGGHLPESDDPEWPLREVAAFEAWQEFFPDPARAGWPTVVAVADTGHRPHPEIISNLWLDEQYDFEDDDRDATDPLDDGWLQNPGHGTGTASIIVSPRGAEDYYPSGKGVSGVAPGARVMPLRVTKSVVLGFFSTWHLARGIEHAARHGAHVVSISLGTVIPSFRLSRAVGYAKKRGVILVAAAGNCTPFVVIPAAYGDVVAVAASNARREIWPGTSRGGSVDVTAPGESVWRAVVDAQHPSVFDVQRGEGTSFSAPIVAGLAALWLARHGREDLIRRYGADKLPKLFTQLLRGSATFVPGWDTDRFGSGLANARRLLAAPLPARVEGDDAAALEAVAAGRDVMWEFARLFEGALAGAGAGQLEARLAALLGADASSLPALLGEVGPELAFHFAANPGLHRRFAAALAPPSETAEAEAGRLASVRESLQAAGVSGALGAMLP